jgi:4-amino-4-deoxy-L-arabinose transferase-like glycosyltransferase
MGQLRMARDRAVRHISKHWRALSFVVLFTVFELTIDYCNVCGLHNPGWDQRILSLLASAGVALAIAISLAWTKQEPILLSTNRVRNRCCENFALYVSCTAGLALAVSLLVSTLILRRFPNSGDEFAYLFQAETYLHGRLWNSPPPIPHIFTPQHIIETRDVWVGEYTPGWPTLISFLLIVGLKPWMINPILNGIAVILLAWLGRETQDRFTGILAAAIYALTAFSIFNGASLFNHPLAATCGVAFALLAIKFLETPSILTGIGSGAALGLIGLTRPQSAVLFALPFVIKVLSERDRGVTIRAIIGLGLGGIPFAIILLAYNWAVTGNPLVMPQMVYDGAGGWGISFDSITRSAGYVVELAEWTSAPLLVIYFISFAYLAIHGRLNFIDYMLPLFLLAFIFFVDPANRYGPRYVFDVYPLFALTCASGLTLLYKRSHKCRPVLAASAALFCVFSLLSAQARIPVVAVAFHRIISERMDLYDLVEEAKLNNAIVLVRSDVGLRLGMDASDLYRNWPDLHQPVLYVGGQAPVEQLKLKFPERSIWTYTRDDQSTVGNLTRID